MDPATAAGIHLKTGADSIGAAFVLASPTGVEIDIDGTDRGASDWDMGAHQLVVAATGNPWNYYRQLVG